MKVTIIGLGLIGSSLAYQLKKNGCQVMAWARNQETIDKAIKLKIIDFGYIDISKVVNSDLIIVALPIELIVSKIIEIDRYLKQKTVVIDVGSVKEYIVREVQKSNLNNVEFVGAHPMAGSDKTGIDNYIKDLFKDKPFIFTYHQIDKKVEEKIMALCGYLGSRFLKMSPREHDEAVAVVSHLPYVLAVTLYNNYSLKKELYSQIASSGFNDTSRVAHSDPLWGAAVAITNKQNILDKLSKAEAIIREIKKAITDDNIDLLLSYLNIDNKELSLDKINLVKKLINVYD